MDHLISELETLRASVREDFWRYLTPKASPRDIAYGRFDAFAASAQEALQRMCFQLRELQRLTAGLEPVPEILPHSPS